MTFGHLTHALSSNTVWDVRVGRFVFVRKDDPSTGNTSIPSRVDRVTGVFSGAPQTFGGLTLIRTTTKGTLNHPRSRGRRLANERAGYVAAQGVFVPRQFRLASDVSGS